MVRLFSNYHQQLAVASSLISLELGLYNDDSQPQEVYVIPLGTTAELPDNGKQATERQSTAQQPTYVPTVYYITVVEWCLSFGDRCPKYILQREVVVVP